MYFSNFLKLSWLLYLLTIVQVAAAANLVHHWTFDEGSGSAVADSVGSADMLISGSSTGWTTGKDGGAFAFDGTNYAKTTADDLVTNPTSSVAIAGWFKTAANTANRSFLFQIEREYEMRISNGQLQLSFNGNASNAPRWGDSVDDGLWHHFVAQNIGGTTQLYIDGFLVGSRTETLSSLNSESKDSAIAAKQSGQTRFAGTFDDIRYYDAFLTESEIQSLAQISNVPPTAQPDSYTVAVNTQLVVSAPGVLSNDTEFDGDVVTASLVSNVAQGSLNLSPDGSFTYDPPTDFVGIISFTYQAVDVDGASSVVSVDLTVLDPASSLTVEEVNQMQTDLGITLSQQEILDVSAIVKPQALSTWRSDANVRIETHRKADLTVEVVDSAGTPISGASVNVKLAKNAFKFGGVVTVMDLTNADSNFAGSLDIAGWKQIVKSMFNSVGFNNGFKPKITSQHTYIPNFLTWAAANDIDVRGHLLMWPGGGDVEDLDNPSAVAGDDYGNHLSTASTSAYASYNVLGAVDTYKASVRDAAAETALESVVDSEITEWAAQWDVYEWDVVNETVGNTLLMDILGYDQMADWFDIAEAQKVNSNADLFINDFQIVSGQFADGSTQYATRRDTYFSRIDQVLADSGPMTGIGFQSRFRYGHIPPETVYARLEEFASRYPSMKLAGTEFEIKDWYDYNSGNLVAEYDETLRAQMTEEILTTYYSHANVTGMNAWDFMNPEIDAGDPTTNRALCYYDGTVKLNGLVWYYLHRIRYHTDVTDSTAANGEVILRGFKGEYDITVSYDGNDYPASYTLLADGSTQIQLNDVTVTPSAPTEATIEHWAFDDVVDTQLTNTVNVSGTAKFFGGSSTMVTDGSGLLVISQDATKATGGNFLGSNDITIGARSTGKYELELILDSVVLTGGDPNGANIGLGFKDSAVGGDLFRIRLNKTTGGLAVNTFFDSTYTGFHTFTDLFSLTEPLKLRVVIDLDTDLADIYMTEGAGTEASLGQIATVSGAVWDQLSFSAVNNTTDWGVNDVIKLDSIKIRKLELDNYGLWQARTTWMGETLTEQADDPDGDNLVNLLEYALGGNPLINDAITILPSLVEFEGAPHYQFSLGVDTPDLNLSLQHSTDLIDWDTIAPTVIHGEAGQLIQIPLLDIGQDKRFSRLSVSEN